MNQISKLERKEVTEFDIDPEIESDFESSMVEVTEHLKSPTKSEEDEELKEENYSSNKPNTTEFVGATE